MLKSRRSGLLAAGLAVAVVGALGVVSTRNAGAEQIPGDQEAAQAPAAAEADAADTGVSTPPDTLPWGAKPVHAHRGKAGTTSRQLHDQGLQAAAGTSTRHLDFAPKGRISGSTVLRSEKTDIAPPEPAPSPSASTDGPADPTTTPATSSPDTSPTGTPTTADTTTPSTARREPVNPVAAAAGTTPPATGGNDANFLYVSDWQKDTADGLYAAMDVKRPVVGAKDFHSLAEVAVQSADQAQTVEVGWTVDRAVNGDSDPHLFVYHWVNGKKSCYNGCGFVPYKDGINAGDTLPVDTTKKFGIEHRNGGWWIAYDTTWVGNFPDSLWSSQGATFTTGGYLQSFGEVAASSTVPCTQMGNGLPATDPSAARIGSITFVNGPTIVQTMLISSSQYGWAPIGKLNKSFYYGGPAATSTPPPASPSPSTSASPSPSASPTPAPPPYNPDC